MDYSTIGGKLECREIAVEGETRIHNCRITASFGMAGAKLNNPAGIALNAGGLTVGGGVFLTDAFAAKGEIRLIGAKLAANLTLTGAHLNHPDGVSVNLDRATIGTVHSDRLTCQGQLSLVGARIAGDLNLAETSLEVRNGRPAMIAQRASIDGTLILSDVSILGEVDLRTVRVGERLLMIGSRLHSPTGTARDRQVGVMGFGGVVCA